jgi:hypothetical protein
MGMTKKTVGMISSYHGLEKRAIGYGNRLPINLVVGEISK